jgi:hypothetical protein
VLQRSSENRLKQNHQTGSCELISGFALDRLDPFQHLENGLGRTHEQAFEALGQATAFQGVAAGAFTFSHDEIPNVFTLKDADYTSTGNPSNAP